MQPMTQAEYARHRGVSRQAINKLINSGKIPQSAFVDGGRIDPAAADFALGEVRERILSSDAADGGLGAAGTDATFGSNAGAIRRSQGGEGVAALTRVRTGIGVYQLRVAELDYAQRVGQLLKIEDVTRAMETCAAVIVREIDQLPTFADDLAAAMSRDGVQGMRAVLKNVARGIREALEKNMRLADVENETAKREEATS
jgi:hypothetical protein